MQVPIALYLMTHAYFCFYHALANVCLRRTSNAVSPGPARLLAMGAVVVLLAYATAFMETLTISHFPYYSFKVSHSLLWHGEHHSMHCALLSAAWQHVACCSRKCDMVCMPW